VIYYRTTHKGGFQPLRTNHVYQTNSLIWRSFGIFAALDTCPSGEAQQYHDAVTVLCTRCCMAYYYPPPPWGVPLGKLCALAPLWSIRILLVPRSYSLPLPAFDLRTISQVRKPRRCAFCVRRSPTSIHNHVTLWSRSCIDQYRIQVYEPGIEW